MKSSRRLFLVITALALQTAGLCVASAQDQGGANAPAMNSPSFSSALTPNERTHLRKVKKQVLANHPDLKAEDDALSQQRDDLDYQGATASPDARTALMAQWHDHQQKVRAEALKIDPMLAPIYAKLDAWKQQHVKPTTSG